MDKNTPAAIVCAVITFSLSACGGATVSDAKILDARSAVNAAEEVGAADLPDAALHLQLAKEGIAKAEKLKKQDKANAATRYLERATADAELAIAMAKAADVREDAMRAKDKVEKLKGEQP